MSEFEIYIGFLFFEIHSFDCNMNNSTSRHQQNSYEPVVLLVSVYQACQNWEEINARKRSTRDKFILAITKTFTKTIMTGVEMAESGDGEEAAYSVNTNLRDNENGKIKSYRLIEI